tara:strand:- start:44999 stop:45835 length:837 start_codon:yes stop_codon:yes gene_type:complete
MSENEKGESGNPRHAPPKGARPQQQDLLYDPDIPTPSHAEYARTMANIVETGTLCTKSTNPSGYPYGSFVTFAIHEGNPIFLISRLAEHTKNLEASPQSSLLVAEGGEGNPLALGRVTLIGDCSIMPEAEVSSARATFLDKHESASFYVDFEDFHFYKLEVNSVRYIGGFGRMSWIDDSGWFDAEPDPMSSFSKDIIEHMNDDHRDAMVDCCRSLSKATNTSDALMTGIDRYGFEMSAITPDGPRPIRLAFGEEVLNSEEARVQIVSLVKAAREISGE